MACQSIIALLLLLAPTCRIAAGERYAPNRRESAIVEGMTTPDETAWPPPPRRRVYLMRHGDVEYFDTAGKPHRPETVPLTELGRAQARTAGAMLAVVPFDRVITSGLRRTDETAALVVENRGLAVTTEPRFREIETGRMSEWAAVPAEAVRQLILRGMDDRLTPESRFLAGETFLSCQQRVGEAWRDLIADRGWSSVLLVAHGVVNRVLLGYCLGMPLSTLGRVEQDAGCVNLIEIDDEGAALVRLVNHTPHDSAKDTLRLTTFEGLYDQLLRGRRPGG
jgi:phosphoserine phosphatase